MYRCDIHRFQYRPRLHTIAADIEESIHRIGHRSRYCNSARHLYFCADCVLFWRAFDCAIGTGPTWNSRHPDNLCGWDWICYRRYNPVWLWYCSYRNFPRLWRWGYLWLDSSELRRDYIRGNPDKPGCPSTYIWLWHRGDSIIHMGCDGCYYLRVWRRLYCNADCCLFVWGCNRDRCSWK